MNCVICGDAIGVDLNGWNGGHNAQPVANGRCCEICNDIVVIPFRLSLLYRRRKDGYKRPEGN